MRKTYVYSLPEKMITAWACGSIDHFRNHGFLLTRKGWVLSLAYDLNPTLSDHQSLLINRMTSVSDLDILLASADDYMLSPSKAHTII